MTIRAKLTAAMGGVVLAAMAGAGGFLFISERRHLVAQRDVGRARALERMAKVAEKAVLQKNDLLFLDYLRSVMEDPEVAAVVFLDAEGKVLAHSDFLSGGDLGQTGREPGTPPPHSVERSKALSIGGSPAGELRVYYDRAKSDEAVAAALRGSLWRFAQVAALSLAFGLGLAALVAAALVRPVTVLAEGARRLGAGDLAVEIPVRSRDELGQLTARFNEMVRELRRLDEAKDLFLSKASHDLRTPVTTLMANVELLLESGPSPAQKPSLERLRDGAAFLSSLSTNLLDLAKIKAGKMEFKMEPVSLRELCAVTADAARAQAEGFGVAITLALEANLPSVLADPDAARRVVTNLLSNGLKFTPSGGRVEMGARRTGPREVELWVKDTGVGVPEEKIPYLFGVFSQVSETRDKARKAAGTGLGLAISREIVEAHGGRIWAERVKEGGTAFRFTLPVAGS